MLNEKHPILDKLIGFGMWQNHSLRYRILEDAYDREGMVSFGWVQYHNRQRWRRRGNIEWDDVRFAVKWWCDLSEEEIASEWEAVRYYRELPLVPQSNGTSFIAPETHDELVEKLNNLFNF